MGMTESECYQQGKLSCVSCHSLHESDPNDQLADRMQGNHACLQCHSEYEQNLEEHTHHAANASGSLCYNCHMPHTTYALFKAIRSHRIDSPSALNSKKTGRPNACNQCHTDRSLQWTSQHLANWYQMPQEELSEDDTEISATVLWALSGDAGQRVVTAWTLGWESSLANSGNNWQPAHLAQLLDDPYSAVRFVAYLSLKKFPGFEDFSYDFAAPFKERKDAKERALAIWQQQEKTRPHMSNVLIDREGKIRQSVVDRLLKARNDRSFNLPE
ncbi:MAG: hypothetical protein KDA84_25840, partial [Planctomycetaceae bacterium]|nr:hypothetical protein [Planctomycetaceae bacterium]